MLRLTQGPAGLMHANAEKLTVQSCLLILIWATVMRTCSKKLYCAPLHKQKLFKDWFLCRREKLWSSKWLWLVFYYIVFLQWPSTWKQLSSWAIPALTSRPSLMSSICKKRKKMDRGGGGEACDQRNKIICIFCHASDPVEQCKMWCAWRKTNSMSCYKALFVSAAFFGIVTANVSLENECAAKKLFLDDLFLLWWIARILFLIFRKSSSLLQGHVKSQDCSCSKSVLFPAAIFPTLGGHFTFSNAFSLHSHCFKHCDTVTRSGGFSSQLDGPSCVFLCLS